MCICSIWIFRYLSNSIPIKIKKPITYYNDQDAILLAKTVYNECGNCGDIDKILVISSVLNRLEHDAFPESIKKVLDNQYNVSNIYTEHDKRLAALVLVDYVRDCNVFYFVSKNATDKKFLKLLKSKKLVCKTDKHAYYEH